MSKDSNKNSPILPPIPEEHEPTQEENSHSNNSTSTEISPPPPIIKKTLLRKNAERGKYGERKSDSYSFSSDSDDGTNSKPKKVGEFFGFGVLDPQHNFVNSLVFDTIPN